MNCEVKKIPSDLRIAQFFRIAVLLTIACCLRVASANAQPQSVEAQTQKATPAAVTEALQIVVDRVRLRSRTGLESVQGQVELRVKVINSSKGKPVSLSGLKWNMTCNTKPCTLNPAIQDALLTSDMALPSGKSSEGWLAFTINHASALEPLLSFTWSNGNQSQTISINDAIRKTSKLKTIRIGPGNCLAVVELHRPMDQIATWLLSAEFEALKKQDVQYVVLDLKPDVSETAPTYSLRRALDSWLISVQKGGDSQRFNFRTQIKSPVQFARFFAAGADSRAGTRVLNSTAVLSSRTLYGTAGSIFSSSRELAIASALVPVYEQLTVEEALKDLNHPETGIQRVALETNIDRLTESQLTNVLDRALSRTPAEQILVAENLHRVSLQIGTKRLSELVRSANSEVSQAALRSLVRSIAPEAATTLKAFWRESNQSESLRQDIVMAIMGAKDYRHLDLLTEFAEEYVTGFFENASKDGNTAPIVSSTDAQTKLQLLIASRSQSRTSTATAPHALVLESVLNFLRVQGETGFADFARRELMNIADYSVQDVVMKYILTNLSLGDERLVENYIGQRLPSTMTGTRLTAEQSDALTKKHGPRIVTRSSRISDTLIATIRKFPSPTYTERLVELSRSQAVIPGLRSNVFQAAVRCASDEQLTEIIAQFGSLKESATTHLLTQLAALQHPEWIRLAEQSVKLHDRETLQNTALGLLRNDGSVESTLIIVAHLEDVRRKSKPTANPAKDVQARNANRINALKTRRQVQRAIQALTAATHPEARRAINRCGRSDNQYIAQLAYQSVINFHNASPNRPAVVEAYSLRKDKKYDEALAIYNKVLDRDPFYSSGYVSRASLKLRDSRPKPAMKDLKQAESLDPENPLIESVMALADIQLGNIDEGLQRSEEILRSIPELQTTIRRDTIYNTACAYARAAEATESEPQRKNYLDRGMKLLAESVDRKAGFDDVQHALNDADLNAFHDHADWSSVLERIGENEKKRLKQR